MFDAASHYGASGVEAPEPAFLNALAQLVADGETSYSDALDHLLRAELDAGRWDGEDAGEERLHLALADAIAVAIDGPDALIDAASARRALSSRLPVPLARDRV
jgi:hypothetical protein